MSVCHSQFESFISPSPTTPVCFSDPSPTVGSDVKLLNPNQAGVSESLIKNGIKGLWGDKGQPSLGPGPAMVLQWTLPWPYNTPNLALYILAIFLHSMQQKWDQWTLGTQRSNLTGSRTRLGPSMDPAIAQQYTRHGPL